LTERKCLFRCRVTLGYGNSNFLHLMRTLHLHGGYQFDVIEPVDPEREWVELQDGYIHRLAFRWLRSPWILQGLNRSRLLSHLTRRMSVVLNSLSLMLRSFAVKYPLLITSKLSWVHLLVPARTRQVLYLTELTELDTLNSTLLPRVLARFDSIVVATEPRADALKQYLDDHHRVIVIENCPSRDELDPIERSFTSPLSILYQGRVSRRYGGRELIELTRELSGRHRLSIVGPVDRELEGEISELQEQGLVDYRGYVPRGELRALRRQFDVGLLAWNDGSANTRLAAPNKLYEYMASGLVVISIANYSARQLHGKYQFGFVAEDGILGITDFLDDTTAAELMEISARNTARVAEEANYEHQASRLIHRLIPDHSLEG
jgi:glycosyltransferase involved in cell wall biosynthesis